MPFDPDAYTRRILAARRAHLAVDDRVVRLLLEIIDQHGNDLARGLANLPADTQRARIVARRIVRELYTQLEERLQALAQDGVRLQYTEIKRLMDQATVEAMREAGASLGTFVPRPPVQAAAAYMARGSVAETFRTLSVAVQGAAIGADELIQEALVKQMSPEKLARKMRRFVKGSEAFTAEELQDLRKVSADRRLAARQMEYNARRIAITEMGNAAHEAQTQTMIEAPMVEAVRWRLSPVRGTQTKPDECDVLATEDLYGLGPGMYPVGRVPTRPHPHDRCWLQSVTRPVERWDEPKPAPRKQNDPRGEALGELTHKQQQAAIASAKRAVANGAEADRERQAQPA